jgi:hypothetical protein
MITKQELTELLSSTETYRIERTISTTDKDKFGEAVCAFANDMPDSGKPGYLLIGVYNDGRLSGLKATDELLQKFAAIRSDGNILPIPAMAVEAFSFPEGDVIAVEVQPSDQPPVRYRGRTWIRIGPRRDIASPAEETILAERKARNFTTFDARPCFGASLDDIDLDLFQHDYLPKAVDAAILASDDRPIERKLESLRLFNSVYNLPTNAAVLLFGRDPRHFFPGAAVQHVSFGGLDKGTEILNEHLFKGAIMKMLPQIDLFIEGKVAMLWGETWPYVDRSAEIDFEWTTALGIAPAGGKVMTFCPTDMVAVNANAQNQGAAIEWLKFLLSVEQRNNFRENNYSTLLQLNKSADPIVYPVDCINADMAAAGEHTRALPIVKGCSTMTTDMCTNVQLMMMNELTPEEAVAAIQAACEAAAG